MEKTQRTDAASKARYCKNCVLLMLVFFAGLFQAKGQCPMVCTNVNLSLDTIAGGQTMMVPENILTNPASCPGGSYVVSMYDPYGNQIGNMINCNWVGYTLIAKVTDTISNNSCWSKVKIEDKSGPNLNCVKDTISCLQLDGYSQGLDRFPFGVASDNCGVSAPVSISVVCTEYPCTNTAFVALCQRTVIATDRWGLTSTCVDSLWIARDTISNLVGPRDTMLNCHIADTIAKDAKGNPIPQRVGVPTIKGNPVWPNYSVCKIISRYDDLVYPICGKSRKIRRQWTVTDWCTKKDTVVLQWIKIMDTTPPTLVVPIAPITASAGAHDCNISIKLTKPIASDCSGIEAINYSVTYFGSKGGAFPTVVSGTFNGNTAVITLPSGVHNIHYFILDSCGLSRESIQEVTVIDAIPPTPVCIENTATTLDPAQCWARVYAEDLNKGSHDNCCSVLYFAAVEMDTLTKYQTLLINKIKSKYGESVYNSKRSFFDLLVDKYINCTYFNEYVDLGTCGRLQVVLRVYEACNVPLYDPHVNGDSRQSHYCKAAYGSELGYVTEFVKALMSKVPANPGDYSFGLAPKNYNDCMVWINVADKQAPTCAVDPVKNAYCDGTPYIANLALWSFNHKTSLLNCPGANGIYDTAYLNLDKWYVGSKIDPYSQFDVPVFKDNCGSVTVTSSTSGSVNNCGAGTLNRTWTGTDQCGQLSTSCSQKLQMIHRSDFEVLFPKDIETDCIQNLAQFNHPTGDNYPKIFDDECEQVGISFQDTRYEIATDACYKIIRTWKLIDWCVYDPNQHNRELDYIVDTSAGYRAVMDANHSRYCNYRWLKDNGDGYIIYTQVIKVINKKAPTITKVDSIITCASDPLTCFGHVNLKMNGSDDCTSAAELKWTILVDFDNNGTVDKVQDVTGSMATLNTDIQTGTHKITFILKDLCGNETRKENIVNVTLCKKPTPYLLNGLAADLMPSTKSLVIWAKDFDAGSSAGCGQKIATFSFSSDTTKKSITFTCDSLGQRFVNVWVTDTYGNQDFARTYILIQDNNHACTGGTQALVANIKGLVKTEEKLDIEKVQVSLEGSNALPSITQTDGAFAFSNMQLGGSYKVMPKKNINPMNGVSTLDLLLIQKHILGVQPITSPYRLIAADINKSNDISSIDLVELRKLILGVYENFPGNDSWRFVPSDFTFKTSNPFDASFPESSTIDRFTKDASVNFVGIKVGDVNGSVTPNQLMGAEVRSPGKEMVFSTREQSFKANQFIEVPFYASSKEQILGYQLTISFDPHTMELVNITPNIADLSLVNFGTQKLSQGIVTTSYNSIRPLTTDGIALFTLKFKSKMQNQLSEVIHLNSKLTAAEAYNIANEVMSVRLDVATGIKEQSYTLLQNIPNPFNQLTRIGFVMPAAGQAIINVFDVSGRSVLTIKEAYQKGYNEVALKRSDLKSAGVYYYQLQSDGFSATRKMVVVE